MSRSEVRSITPRYHGVTSTAAVQAPKEKCHVPWLSMNRGIAHPIIREWSRKENSKLKSFCFNRLWHSNFLPPFDLRELHLDNLLWRNSVKRMSKVRGFKLLRMYECIAAKEDKSWSCSYSTHTCLLEAYRAGEMASNQTNCKMLLGRDCRGNSQGWCAAKDTTGNSQAANAFKYYW